MYTRLGYKRHILSLIVGLQLQLLLGPYGIISSTVDGLVISVPLSRFLPIVFLLRNHAIFNFTMLIDIAAVDNLTPINTRFHVSYLFLSPEYSIRIRLVTACSVINGIPSLIKFYQSANWSERELWDMFGIYVLGHPDLRRILTDYSFNSHPLRKDFPLTGFYDITYVDRIKLIHRRPVELASEYRPMIMGFGWDNSMSIWSR
jgi:NADH:ubiquinone oxidoreductase subunit C